MTDIATEIISVFVHLSVYKLIVSILSVTAVVIIINIIQGVSSLRSLTPFTCACNTESWKHTNIFNNANLCILEKSSEN